jgi:RsiW-degrading membrane proteinase PrsW (M82 family)
VSEHEVRGDEVAPGTLPRHLWLVTLVVGAGLWAAVTVSVVLTDDPILVPNLILLGSFLVPVCTVLFVLGRPREVHLSVEALIVGFLAGGTAGVVLTGTTEVYVLPDHFGTNALIGLIEESGKALILIAVAVLVKVRVPRDGMVLGATVGAGYSAFESAGYALGALIQYTDRPVLNVLQTEAERASLAPFGHIAWTAILGGAIFASAWTTGRFRVDRRVVWTFLGVAALHGCWDASYGLAIRITEGLGGEGWQFGWPDTAAWIGTPTGGDLLRFQIVYAVLQVLLSLIGLVWAIRRWRRYQIDRWSDAHPRPRPSRAVAHQ